MWVKIEGREGNIEIVTTIGITNGNGFVGVLNAIKISIKENRTARNYPIYNTTKTIAFAPDTKWFFGTYYAKLLSRCQNNKALFLKLSKFLNPNPQRFKTFNRLLIPSTTALVVFCSK